METIKISGSETGQVFVGKECSIGTNVSIVFMGSGTVNVGDYVTLGDNVKMLIENGEVNIGDWTTVHQDTTIFCKNGVSIGAHCWFGQNSVIDGTGGLTIENGVRVGMYSQLWTHVAAGEQIEGCTLYGETPSHIESNAWLVGTCTLGSGVRVGSRTIALAGSNITRSCPSGVVVAGAPAEIKERLNFYRPVSLDEKFEMIITWIKSFSNNNSNCLIKQNNDILSLLTPQQGTIHFYKYNQLYRSGRKEFSNNDTHCCIETKLYTKKFSQIEKSVLKYLSGNKARFYCE